MIRYYDKYCKPLDLMEWAKLTEKKEYRRIGLTKLWWGGVVSTVWLGLNHNFHDKGVPIIFESMVFGWSFRSHCRPDLEMDRYSGLADARKGHERLVKKWCNPIMAMIRGR